MFNNQNNSVMNTLLVVLLIIILIGLIVWFCYSQQKKKDPIYVTSKTIERLERALDRKDLSEKERFQLKCQLIQANFDYSQAIKALNDDTIKMLMESHIDKIQKLQEEMRESQELHRQRDKENLEELKRIIDDLLIRQ